MIYLDTHVVVWLYAGHRVLLSPLARQHIEANDLLISPMVLLELDALHEIGRVTVPGQLIVEDLGARIGLSVCPLPFARVVASARAQRWTRDPFDRVIVGQAAVDGRILLTCNRTIRDHYPRAEWDGAGDSPSQQAQEES